MIRWGEVEALSLLLLVPVLAAFLAWAWSRRMAALDRFGNAELLAKLTASVDRGKQKLKLVLIVVGFIFLVLTLARPQWGETKQEVKRQGLDIIVALDTSLSMAAEDVKPSRIERAKFEIDQLINRIQGDRIGLVVFEGEAIVQCPLTLDYGAARLFLKEIDVGMLPTPGTNLAEAIRIATRAFVQEEQKYKVLILVTDGEQTASGEPLEVAKQAATQGVTIYTIGVGRSGGSPIQYRDENGKLVTKKDRQGRPVITKLDALTLEKIALETGGSYIPADAEGLKLDAIYEEIRAKERKELQSQMHLRFTERFQLPLAIAIVILLVEVLLTDRRRRSALQEEWS